MTDKTISNLGRAADHVDAIRLSDGRWAHYDDGVGRWYVVTEAELEELCDYLDADDESIRSDAYSHWCAGTDPEEMRAGWDPDRSYIDIVVPADDDEDDCLAAAEAAYIEEHRGLDGYDLSPRWTDESTRETVTLTVPFRS